MEETVEYRGFGIAAQSGTTESGKCWGKYKVSATSDGAKEVIARHAISGFGTEKIHETSDIRASNPDMLNIRHLIEMAKGEVDQLLKRDKEEQAQRGEK